MKLCRLILACTLLLLAAVPTFALPPCSYCEEEGVGPCLNDSGSGSHCRFSGGGCETVFGPCIGFADRTLLSEWNVASIEITRQDPATHRLTTIVITPTTIQGVTAQLTAPK